jgi:ankyrin repeat protein
LATIPDSAADQDGSSSTSCLDIQVQPSRFTAFMLACRNGHAQIVQALVEKGSRTDLTSSKGQTGWDLAMADLGQNRDVRIFHYVESSFRPRCTLMS